MCRAKTDITVTLPDVKRFILDGKYGLGQILEIKNIRAVFEIESMGQDEKHFWRVYCLRGPGVVYKIREEFNKALYDGCAPPKKWKRNRIGLRNGSKGKSPMMMDYPLTLIPILERAGRLFGKVEIVSRLDKGSLHRYCYADFYRRARALAAALQNADSSAATCSDSDGESLRSPGSLFRHSGGEWGLATRSISGSIRGT